MSRKMLGMALASVLAFTALRKRLFSKTARIATAAYPDFSPEGLEASLFEITTTDGVTLRGKRYANEGKVPVILMAGFAGNGFNYDLAFEECNMAVFLARRGFDVWVANFRGTGREPYKSDRKDSPHSIEDVAVYDAPALATGVVARTGRKPVMVGHSMGAVICYGFLQGLVYVDDEAGVRVEPDAELSKQRNEEVAAVVSVAGPTCFRWPVASKNYWLMGSPISRVLLRPVRSGLGFVSRRTHHVPIETMVTTMLKVAPRLGQLVLRLALFNFLNMKNTTPETFVEVLASGGSDVSFVQAYQLLDALLEQDFTGMSAVGGGGAEPHNFTNSIDMITAPILFVTGELDPVDHRTVYREGFLKVASEVKDYRCFIDFGHLDLLLGTEARSTVFPYIASWLEKVTE